ncbi:hypothetical protein CR513_18007, partial [Mucuna pruriens]
MAEQYVSFELPTNIDISTFQHIDEVIPKLQGWKLEIRQRESTMLDTFFYHSSCSQGFKSVVDVGQNETSKKGETNICQNVGVENDSISEMQIDLAHEQETSQHVELENSEEDIDIDKILCFLLKCLDIRGEEACVLAWVPGLILALGFTWNLSGKSAEPSSSGITLPFTTFERSVLCALNIAPTQLHPNNWAFVRTFELLSEDLGREPYLGVFFWFFSPCRTEKVGWTSLSSHHGRQLMKPFCESYKQFKENFFGSRKGRLGRASSSTVMQPANDVIVQDRVAESLDPVIEVAGRSPSKSFCVHTELSDQLGGG